MEFNTGSSPLHQISLPTYNGEEKRIEATAKLVEALKPVPLPSELLVDQQTKIEGQTLQMVQTVQEEKKVELDTSFIVEENSFGKALDWMRPLMQLGQEFDTAAYLSGEKGQTTAPSVEKNRGLLKKADYAIGYQAQLMVKQGQAKDLKEAYKKMVGLADRYDQQNPKESSYFLRCAILQASHTDGVGLDSWCVFTKGGKPAGSSIWSFLEKAHNWVPEAQGARAKWIEKMAVKTRALSSQFTEKKVVLLKGGFGAGKTRLITQQFGAFGEGAIAPDKAKEIDRRASPKLPHAAAHVHGSQAAYELMNEVISKGEGTVIYDSSLSDPADLTHYLQACKEAGKRMEVYDVARYDMARALAVLKRPVAGEDPRIPPDFIIRSAIKDKLNRVKCMEVVLNDGATDEKLRPIYHFISADKQGWNSEEVLTLSSNGSVTLTPKAKERLALEGIHFDEETKRFHFILDEETLKKDYVKQFESPVKDIVQELSKEEQETLNIFKERVFKLTLPLVTNSLEKLYEALPREIHAAIPHESFIAAFKSLQPQTLERFLSSLTDKTEFCYEDLPLRAALALHASLKSDPWTVT